MSRLSEVVASTAVNSTSTISSSSAFRMVRGPTVGAVFGAGTPGRACTAANIGEQDVNGAVCACSN